MATNKHFLFRLHLLSVLGCGLMAGVFFAFSVFVMSALSSLQWPQGIGAMQAINIKVINPVFMLVFMGTTMACVGLLVFALLNRGQPGAKLLLVGSLLYLVGTFGVTAAFNVPLNDALSSIKPNTVGGVQLWADYIAVWTLWNHVRTIAATGAATALTLAFRQRAAE